MQRQHFLHFTRIDVAAAGDDHVLGTVGEGQEALLVEVADVAGVEPAVHQGRGAGGVVAPVAAHHRGAAHGDLARHAGRQRLALRIHHAHLDAGLRLADRRGQPLPVRVRAVGDQLARQRGDGHRAFALAVDLDQPRAEGGQRLLQVGQVHRRTAVDDRLDALAGITLTARLVGHPLDHGWRREQAQLPVTAGQLEQLAGAEAARYRHHVARAAAHVDEVVQPGAVGHRRGVDEGIVGIHRIDVHRVAQRHRREVAVAEHHALGAPGGARGVEQPRKVVGTARLRPWRGGATRLEPRDGFTTTGQLDAAGVQLPGAEQRAVVGEDQPRLGVFGDPSRLAAVQLAVDRHRHCAGPPDRVEEFEVLAAVLHEQGDALARDDAVFLAQNDRQRRGVGGETGVVADQPLALEQRRALRPASGRIVEPVGDVHPQALRACSTLA